MTLGELIARLERADPDRAVPLGFGGPHSYRGYYEQLAFEPRTDVTVGYLLSEARSALGKSFPGYKGGTYAMYEHTDVWLAEYGSTGEGIGPALLAYMLGEVPAARREGER